MNYFKKNKLISFIIVAMLIGLVVGYAVNLSITQNKFEYDKSKLNSISNPEIKKQVISATARPALNGYLRIKTWGLRK